MKREIVLMESEKRLCPTTRANLEAIVKKRLNNEYDYVLLIVALVGKGKSMLSALACEYISSLTGRKFSVDNVFFTTMDFRMRERKLKDKDSLDFDEGEEVFFSRSAMSIHQKRMVLKFAQVRQRNFFIVICTPSLMLLEKWVRGIGKETRINCIWRIIRRGMFYSYSAKTGSLQKIKIDKATNDIKYPRADFIGFWQPIPKSSDFWKKYLKKKRVFLTATKESKKVIRQRERMAKKMGDSLTIRDMAEIHGVKPKTARGWVNKYKVFPKRSVFIDMTGRIRIKFKGYEIGLRRLERIKQQRLKIQRARMEARNRKLVKKRRRKVVKKTKKKSKKKGRGGQRGGYRRSKKGKHRQSHSKYAHNKGKSLKKR